MFDYSLKALTQKLKNPAETSKTQKEEKKEIKEKIDKLPGRSGRRELGGRIDGDVASHLERLRRG